MLGFFRHLWFLKRLGLVWSISSLAGGLSYGDGSVRSLDTPMAFEPNEGQFPAGRVFGARYKGYEIALDDAGLEIDPGGFPGSHLAIRLSCEPEQGEKPILTGRDRLPGVSHYFIGKEPWLTGIAQFRRVHYAGLCSGIDMQVYGTSEGIEYDLIIAPGVDPQRVSILFEGAEGLRLDERGNLLVKIFGRTWRQPAPTMYQEKHGKRISVAGGYIATDDAGVRFWASEYDQSSPLIIDPVLVFSTLIGGASASAIATDSDANIYIAGGDGRDVMVTKLKREGTSIIYSARIGGSSGESANGIVVDKRGNAYLAGITSSSDFPVRDPIQPNSGGSSDAFFVKLDTNGELLISTFLGGSSSDSASGIALDGAGNVYLTGLTGSVNFPITPGTFQTKISGGADAFIAKVKDDGSTLEYSTYVGGSGDDAGNSVTVDAFGTVLIVGTTSSADFPQLDAIQSTHGGGRTDAFAVKVETAGTKLRYSTFLGGSGNDEGLGISLDKSGNAYLVGSTGSADFPTVNAVQRFKGGGADVFVTKLRADGQSIEYSTFIGGSDEEVATGVAVTSRGEAVITGYSRSNNFPLKDPVQPAFGGGECRAGGIITFPVPCADVFITKLAASGSQVLFSTYVGGNQNDRATSIALDGSGGALVTGGTNSSDWPTTHRLSQTAVGGTFIIKVQEGSRLFFPQFGDGEQSGASIASQIILANPDADKPAEVEIALNDSTGNPMLVDLNGQLVAGTTTFTIAPSGVVTLTTDGQGKLQVGSVVVTSDKKISGVILFRASVGLAGVGASRASNRLSIPVLTDGELSSGVAIMNVGGAQTINLTLRNAEGTIVARALIHLPEKGQLARFVTEVDWDVTPDFSDFSGTLVIEARSQLAAAAILVSRNRYATLPVMDE